MWSCALQYMQQQPFKENPLFYDELVLYWSVTFHGVGLHVEWIYTRSVAFDAGAFSRFELRVTVDPRSKC